MRRIPVECEPFGSTEGLEPGWICCGCGHFSAFWKNGRVCHKCGVTACSSVKTINRSKKQVGSRGTDQSLKTPPKQF